jgi:hypothetical protein
MFDVLRVEGDGCLPSFAEYPVHIRLGRATKARLCSGEMKRARLSKVPSPASILASARQAPGVPRAVSSQCFEVQVAAKAPLGMITHPTNSLRLLIPKAASKVPPGTVPRSMTSPFSNKSECCAYPDIWPRLFMPVATP